MMQLTPLPMGRIRTEQLAKLIHRRGETFEQHSIAPGLKRAAIIFNPDTLTASLYLPSLETAARSLKVMPIIDRNIGPDVVMTRHGLPKSWAMQFGA